MYAALSSPASARAAARSASSAIRKSGRQTGRVGVLPQDGQPQRVERTDGDVLGDRAEQAVEAVPQLLGGPPGERDRQAVLGEDVQLRAEVRDPVGERPGLAGARTGHDQQRAARRGGGHPLHGVQPVQQAGADLLHPGEHRLERLVRRRRRRDRRRRAPGRLALRLRPSPPPGAWPSARAAGSAGRRCAGTGTSNSVSCRARAGAQLGRVEEGDHAVLAVVAGHPADVAAAQPADALGEQLAAGLRDLARAASWSGSPAPGRARRAAR